MARYFGGFRDRLKKKTRNFSISEKDIQWLKMATSFSWSPARREYQWLEPEDYLSSFLNSSISAQDSTDNPSPGSDNLYDEGGTEVPYSGQNYSTNPFDGDAVDSEPEYDLGSNVGDDSLHRAQSDILADLPHIDEYKLEISSALQRRGIHVNADNIQVPDELALHLNNYQERGRSSLDSYELRARLQYYKKQVIQSYEQLNTPTSGFQAFEESPSINYDTGAQSTDPTPMSNLEDDEKSIVSSLDRLEASLREDSQPVLEKEIERVEEKREENTQDDSYPASFSNPPSSFADDSWLVLPIDSFPSGADPSMLDNQELLNQDSMRDGMVSPERAISDELPDNNPEKSEKRRSPLFKSSKSAEADADTTSLGKLKNNGAPYSNDAASEGDGLLSDSKQKERPVSLFNTNGPPKESPLDSSLFNRKNDSGNSGASRERKIFDGQRKNRKEVKLPEITPPANSDKLEQTPDHPPHKSRTEVKFPGEFLSKPRHNAENGSEKSIIHKQDFDDPGNDAKQTEDPFQNEEMSLSDIILKLRNENDLGSVLNESLVESEEEPSSVDEKANNKEDDEDTTLSMSIEEQEKLGINLLKIRGVEDDLPIPEPEEKELLRYDPLEAFTPPSEANQPTVDSSPSIGDGILDLESLNDRLGMDQVLPAKPPPEESSRPESIPPEQTNLDLSNSSFLEISDQEPIYDEEKHESPIHGLLEPDDSRAGNPTDEFPELPNIADESSRSELPEPEVSVFENPLQEKLYREKKPTILDKEKRSIPENSDRNVTPQKNEKADSDETVNESRERYIEEERKKLYSLIGRLEQNTVESERNNISEAPPLQEAYSTPGGSAINSQQDLESDQRSEQKEAGEKEALEISRDFTNETSLLDSSSDKPDVSMQGVDALLIDEDTKEDSIELYIASDAIAEDVSDEASNDSTEVDPEIFQLNSSVEQESVLDVKPPVTDDTESTTRLEVPINEEEEEMPDTEKDEQVQTIEISSTPEHALETKHPETKETESPPLSKEPLENAAMEFDQIGLEFENLLSVVECLAFAAEEPIPIKKIARIYSEVQGLKMPTESEVLAAVDKLNESYEKEGRAFRIKSWGRGIRMATHPQFANYIRALYQNNKPKKLSRTLMETLSIVAYSQPTTKPEIDFVRGVDSDYAVRKLLELGLIDIVGRSEAIGRPLLYGTSERFLDQFGLSEIEALPKLREVEDLLGDPAFQKERLHLLALEGLDTEEASSAESKESKEEQADD